MASCLQPATSLTTGDVTLHYRVAALSTCDGHVETFWFEDAADMLDRLRRKLGMTETANLVDQINAIGLPEVWAAEDPLDCTHLIVAADEDALCALAQARAVTLAG